MSYKPVSMAPSTFVAGGLINNINIRLQNCRFAHFTYGNTGTTAPGLLADAVDVTTGEVHKDQFWSCGGGGKFSPSQDGRYLLSQGEAMQKNSNLSLFLKSLTTVGVPEAILNEGDALRLNGITFHCIRKKVAELDPTANRSGLAGGDKDKEILIADKLLALPNEGQQFQQPQQPQFQAPPQQQFQPPVPQQQFPPWQPPAAAATPAPAMPATAAPMATTAPPMAAGVSPESQMAVLNIVSELKAQTQFPVAQTAFSTQVFQRLLNSAVPVPERAPAIQLVSNPQFLAQAGLTTDGTSIKAA